MNNFIRLLKQKKTIIPLSVVVGLGAMIFLVFRFFTPFGAVVSYQFNSMFNPDKLSKIQGAEETSSFNPTQAGVLQIPQQTVRQNVVTFNLKLITKPIEGVWVNLRFKGNPKEIKMGVRGSEKEKYQYQPLYNQILNSLTWNQTSEGGITFWQREKKYNDIFGLVSKTPVSDEVKVASYFFNPSDISVKESKPTTQANLKIEKTLRGSHTLFVKVDKKPFLLTVVKQDANIYKGEDVLSIQIYNSQQNKILEQLIPDDGVINSDGLMMTPQKGEIKIDDIKPGVYKIVLKDMTTNADVLIKLIETNQSSTVSSNMFIVDEKPTTLWTNSKKITMSTPHVGGIQTVTLDGKYSLKVEKKAQNFEFNLTNPESKNATPSAENALALHKLEIPNNDLAIGGDGYFTFSQESFFDPEPIKTVDLSTVTDLSKIDYIIANYQQAKKDGEWYTAQAYFDSTDIKIDNDKLYFSLESPGLSSYGGEIVIDNLEVTVKKPGWFSTTSKDSWNSDKNTVQKETNKQNIFTRFGDGVLSVTNSIATTFKNAWKKVSVFFGEIFNKPATKKETKTPSPIIIPAKTASPSTTLKSSPTPTSTSSAVILTTLVHVLNGGAEKGAAASVSATLKSNGFTNVKAENSDHTDYKGVTINYRKDDIKTVEKIEFLLNKEYGTVTKIPITTSTAEIVVILGKK